MLSPRYPIRTERLLLRPLDPATDVDAAFAYQSREDVCRYIPYPPRTRERVVERLTVSARDHVRLDEAGQALLGLAFDDLGLHRVTARLDARNDASAAIVRRLGMRLEATLVENEWFKGEWSTELGFAILADEWRGGPSPD